MYLNHKVWIIASSLGDDPQDNRVPVFIRQLSYPQIEFSINVSCCTIYGVSRCLETNLETVRNGNNPNLYQPSPSAVTFTWRIILRRLGSHAEIASTRLLSGRYCGPTVTSIELRRLRRRELKFSAQKYSQICLISGLKGEKKSGLKRRVRHEF